MKRGIYETEYGNAAVVLRWDAKTAFDLDLGERVPIETVRADKFIRKVGSDDILQVILK